MELTDLMDVLKYNIYIHLYFNDRIGFWSGSPNFIRSLMDRKQLPAYYVREISQDNEDDIMIIHCERK